MSVCLRIGILPDLFGCFARLCFALLDIFHPAFFNLRIKSLRLISSSLKYAIHVYDRCCQVSINVTSNDQRSKQINTVSDSIAATTWDRLNA